MFCRNKVEYMNLILFYRGILHFTTFSQSTPLLTLLCWKIWRNTIRGHVLVTSDDVRFSQSLPTHSVNQCVCWIVYRTGLSMSINLCMFFECTEKDLLEGLSLQWEWQRKWNLSRILSSNYRSIWQQIVLEHLKKRLYCGLNILYCLINTRLFSFTQYHASFDWMK
jgi:hypothetical protein